MGRATARLFADEGARVVVADLGDDRVAAVVDEINEVYGEKAALGVTCDVADPAQLRDLVSRTVGWAAGIDIVVNNAGISVPNDLAQDEEQFEQVWGRTVDVNLTSQARLVRYALPHLLESDSGRIVNIASTEAIMSMAGLISYSASKAGVTGLTKSMAVELGPRGITANCICPGPISTAMTERFPDEQKEAYARRRVPVGRYGEPEEVAHMTLNLCLPASSYVNGVVVPVDGGLTIRHL
jgi:3-oxoacyl-[acyl-carrier protein] reductase